MQHPSLAQTDRERKPFFKGMPQRMASLFSQILPIVNLTVGRSHKIQPIQRVFCPNSSIVNRCFGLNAQSTIGNNQEVIDFGSFGVNLFP